MFTGLVEALGTVVAFERRGPGARLSVRCPFDPIVLGESIACDGVCLTVDGIGGDRFHADASAETLSRTTLGGLRVGSELHLERALALGQRLGGHIVSGHVDGVAEFVSSAPLGEAVRLEFLLPKDLQRYVAVKGSVTLAGVSLTVNSVEESLVSVVIVPRTQRWTTLAERRPGDHVNVEVDLLARYVERLLEAPRGAASAPSDDRDSTLLGRLGDAGYL